MIKPKDPRELAVALTSRSICSVQVAAVLADNWGIHAWGTNHIGFDGLGCHAEIECLRRANRRRVGHSTLYVAAVRKRNGKTVNARPCADCWRIVSRCDRVVYRDAFGIWRWL